MLRTTVRVISATILLVGGFFAVAPGTASAHPDCEYYNGTVCYQEEQLDPGDHFQCFGHPGDFKHNTDVIKVDWQNDGSWDECFGVGANRKIYHTWPQVTTWLVMPNGGLADNTYSAFPYQGQYRTVSVQVARSGGGVTYYCSSVKNSAWGAWGICSNPPKGTRTPGGGS